jgi:hypothetical protein
MNDYLIGMGISDVDGDRSGDVRDERSRLTRAALADVGAGRVIDHLSVQTWADSLSTDIPLS